MAITPAVLTKVTQLGTVAATMATGAPLGRSVVTRAVVSNVSTLASTFSIWIVPSGTTAVPTNLVIDNRTVAVAPATDLVPELAGAVLNAGDIIQASSGTAATLNFFASGYNVV